MSCQSGEQWCNTGISKNFGKNEKENKKEEDEKLGSLDRE